MQIGAIRLQLAYERFGKFFGSIHGLFTSRPPLWTSAGLTKREFIGSGLVKAVRRSWMTYTVCLNWIEYPWELPPPPDGWILGLKRGNQWSRIYNPQ